MHRRRAAPPTAAGGGDGGANGTFGDSLVSGTAGASRNGHCLAVGGVVHAFVKLVYLLCVEKGCSLPTSTDQPSAARFAPAVNRLQTNQVRQPLSASQAERELARADFERTLLKRAERKKVGTIHFDGG